MDKCSERKKLAQGTAYLVPATGNSAAWLVYTLRGILDEKTVSGDVGGYIDFDQDNF